MSRGIILYNSGTSCLIRTIVCLYSLRQVYDGNIVIFYPSRDCDDNKFAIKVCERAGDIFNCEVKMIDMNVSKGKNRIFLERTKYHTKTPFDVSMSLDSDTIVLDRRIQDYLDAAEENEYSIASFAKWGTSRGMICRRILYWHVHYPDLIEAAVAYGSAINCGCFAFRKDSRLMNAWYEHALVGRNTFIADETCMQVLLPHYPHQLLSSNYNTSCKYDKHITDKDYPVMIHYHGKKHCRFDDNGKPKNHCHLWLNFLAECVRKGIFDKLGMDISQNNYGDKMFRKNSENILRYVGI